MSPSSTSSAVFQKSPAPAAAVAAANGAPWLPWTVIRNGSISCTCCRKASGTSARISARNSECWSIFVSKHLFPIGQAEPRFRGAVFVCSDSSVHCIRLHSSFHVEAAHLPRQQMLGRISGSSVGTSPSAAASRYCSTPSQVSCRDVMALAFTLQHTATPMEPPACVA